MAKDAEAHASEDKEAREQVEARNGLDSIVYNVEKMLKDAGDKVSSAEKSETESALADAKSTLTGSPSATEMNAAKDRLTAASHKVAEGHVQGGQHTGRADRWRGRRRRHGRPAEGRGCDRRRVCRRRFQVTTMQAAVPCSCLPSTEGSMPGWALRTQSSVSASSYQGAEAGEWT